MYLYRQSQVVSVTSKIRILKAIHNRTSTLTTTNNGCFRNVKDKNFESDSQLGSFPSPGLTCCFRNVKDKNFESDSQQMAPSSASGACCFRNVKDKNFESDSQLWYQRSTFTSVVSVTSKIRILKAIHNCQIPILKILRVVSVTSKIRILKAIHNYLHRRNFIIVLFP